MLLKDLDIPIVSYSFKPAPINIYKVYHTILEIRSFKERNQKLAQNADPIILSIRWDPPIDANALDSFPKGKYNGERTTEVHKYLSKQIVGKIVETEFKLNK